MDFVLAFWNVMLELAPWLLLGTAIAGVLHVALPKDFTRQQLGGGSGSVFKAVLLGVPLPLCSCGVIPTGLGLRRDGASNGASVGFLIATPQTGVDAILVSASMLGWPFALFKVAAAFVTGVVGGLATDALVPEDAGEIAAQAGSGQGATGWRGALDYMVNDLLYMIWGWLLFGVAISALITTLVPPGFLAVYATGTLALLLVLGISVPLYVCATSSVPIAAALVHAGLPPGAALVFLMAGPATNVATIGAVYKALGSRALGVYLATIIGGSLLFGFAFDSLLLDPAVVTGHVEHGHGLVGTLSAVLLLGLFARFAWLDLRAALKRPPRGADELVLEVQGMTCKGCARKVETGLSALDGVSGVAVDLEGKRATIAGAALDRARLAARVRELGFDAL
jgi:uncharacterized protein